MRLLKAHVSNFKLLEDVEFEFSTDSQRPLTVIRAENGSGKTSLLYALSWGFFGEHGLPEEARGLRLISSNSPAGVSVVIQVTIEFEHTSDLGTPARYRLVRTASETPRSETDRVDKGPHKVRLVRLTSAGDEDVDEALLEKLLPRRLKDVFFTNGEDVQTFIAGVGAAEQQQKHVRDAIRALLGLDSLEMAVSDIDSVVRRLRSEAAKSAGADVEKAEDALALVEADLSGLQLKHEAVSERLRGMREEKARSEKELKGIQGIGDLDKLNSEIEGLTRDVKRLEDQRAGVLAQLRGSVRSEDFTWALASNALQKGLGVLQELADRKVIPGVSVEVLNDRLAIGECICGESLDERDDAAVRRRSNVQRVIDDQRLGTESSQRMTGTWHVARTSLAGHKARVEGHQAYWDVRSRLLGELVTIRNDIVAKNARLGSAKDDRSKIDDARVRELTERVTRIEVQISVKDRELGEIAERIRATTELRDARKRDRDGVEKTKDKHSTVSRRREVADDLLRLTQGTLSLLQKDYVQRVGAQTSERFMKIVGSDPNFAASIFTGVRIEENTFKIVVESHGGRQLDPAFELNGASQRALTLAFIWALTDVSGTSAPRIIDTPLGMVAGGVKARMVEAITSPPAEGSPDFQVVLLLTRSEIRDIEDLLDQAGAVTTMSCSKDFPADLRFRWDVDRAVVRTCKCDHRRSCRLCARRYDEQHGVTFVDEMEVR